MNTEQAIADLTLVTDLRASDIAHTITRHLGTQITVDCEPHSGAHLTRPDGATMTIDTEHTHAGQVAGWEYTTTTADQSLSYWVRDVISRSETQQDLATRIVATITTWAAA